LQKALHGASLHHCSNKIVSKVSFTNVNLSPSTILLALINKLRRAKLSLKVLNFCFSLPLRTANKKQKQEKGRETLLFLTVFPAYPAADSENQRDASI